MKRTKQVNLALKKKKNEGIFELLNTILFHVLWTCPDAGVQGWDEHKKQNVNSITNLASHLSLSLSVCLSVSLRLSHLLTQFVVYEMLLLFHTNFVFFNAHCENIRIYPTSVFLLRSAKTISSFSSSSSYFHEFFVVVFIFFSVCCSLFSAL